MSAAQGYTLAAAIALLALAIINVPAVTLAAATIGFGVGVWLASRGSLGRGGVIGVVGYMIAVALALFALARR